ncbi:MAG: sulfite exporter TauE/SafE family protein [Deltaproteobacteria bacterium]|nr:sulfite exporter TauE/SafE family protein [Deltaproteobacteria bacterium]
MDVPASFGLVLFLSFLVESAVGFGSALVTVSLGGHLMPLDKLFPVFQPLSLVLSLTLVIRGRAHINTRFLFREVLPAMLPGVVVGMALFRIGRPDALLLGVGVAIAVLASFELQRTLRGQETVPLPPMVRAVVLLFAGVIHGLFGTSGPPVVWVATRTLPDKTEFRATLALLWLVLSVLLVAGYVVDGSLRLPQLEQSALLAVPLVLGFVVGNLLHAHVPQRAFRLAVCVLLVVAGTALVVRALPALG